MLSSQRFFFSILVTNIYMYLLISENRVQNTSVDIPLFHKIKKKSTTMLQLVRKSFNDQVKDSHVPMYEVARAMQPYW